jgi:hypothetical protein
MATTLITPNVTQADLDARSGSQRKDACEEYRDLVATQEVLSALAAASQKKGSPLSDAERLAIYQQFDHLLPANQK